MVGKADLLKKLVAVLRALDDDAYAALANKGLLRRARKDLEGGLPVEVGEVAGETLALKVAGCDVRIPASGPAQATCSCPAPGCCQHILAACLRLPELVPAASGEQETPAPAAEDSGALPDVDAVKKWAGTENFRRALRLLHAGDLQGVEGRLVRFEGDIETRLLPGGLDAAISNAAPRQRIAYVAAAALALLQQAGVGLPFEQPGSGPLDLGVLEDLQLLIEEAVEVGLNHLSRSFQLRLTRLSVHCRVAGLVRPSLEAESCAQEIEWLLARHASSAVVRLFDKLARLYALAESIRQQGPAAARGYVGMARSHYAETGPLDLVGAGCYPWETESGFIGLTSIFWSRSANQFFSWSDSRPKHSSAGFNPRQRYTDAGPWSGGGMLQRLVMSRFSLERCKANEQRRISARAGTAVIEPQVATVSDLPPCVTRWKELGKREKPRGLLRGSPLDEVVHVRPKTWGKPFFDEVEQRLIVPLEDEDGRTLTVQLPFSQLTASAVFFLEAWKPDAARDSLIAYHRRKPAEHLFPVRLIRSGAALETIDLLFQPMPARKVTFRGTTFERLRAYVPLPQADDESFTEMELTDPLAVILSPVDDLLVAAAESNLATFSPAAKKSAEVLRRSGLSAFADLIETIKCARDILRARYVYLILIEP